MSRSAVAANINSCVADYAIVPHTSANNAHQEENVKQDADANKYDILTTANTLTLTKPTTAGTNFPSASVGSAAIIFFLTTFAFIFIFRALIGRAKRKSEFGVWVSRHCHNQKQLRHD
jgi:hypothetical protein